jgi:hypothetical protein
VVADVHLDQIVVVGLQLLLNFQHCKFIYNKNQISTVNDSIIQLTFS